MEPPEGGNIQRRVIFGYGCGISHHDKVPTSSAALLRLRMQIRIIGRDIGENSPRPQWAWLLASGLWVGSRVGARVEIGVKH